MPRSYIESTRFYTEAEQTLACVASISVLFRKMARFSVLAAREMKGEPKKITPSPLTRAIFRAVFALASFLARPKPSTETLATQTKQTRAMLLLSEKRKNKQKR